MWETHLSPNHDWQKLLVEYMGIYHKWPLFGKDPRSLTLAEIKQTSLGMGLTSKLLCTEQ